MILIKVLGPGCSNCERVTDLVNQAVVFLNIEARVDKVTDPSAIRTYKILATPGLVVNGKVVCAGRIPTLGEITTWLTNVLVAEP
jgi:small redox-active disulfide protein 2